MNKNSNGVNKIFKNLIIISFFSFFILASFQSVKAGTAEQFKAAGGSAGYSATQETPTNIVIGIVRAGLGLVGTVFLVLIVYAGVLWMTAGGNDEQVTQAKKTMVRVFIGLVIVISSYSISLFAEKLVRGGRGGTSICVDTPTGGQCCKGDPCWGDMSGTWGVGN